MPTGAKQQALELVVTWKGGRSVDLVRLVVDGAFRRPRDVRLDSGRERLVIGLEVDARASHAVELSVSFVGESRTDLALEVSVDGTRTGGPVRVAQATQKWDARWPAA